MRIWSDISRTARWSILGLSTFCFMSLLAELWLNDRPLFVAYEGHWYFPSYTDSIAGQQLGQVENWQVDWKTLQDKAKEEPQRFTLVMPLIPWGPDAIDLSIAPPAPPHPKAGHWLGTDSSGRDVLARIVYGFRIGFGCALLITLASFALGTLFAFCTSLGPPWVDLLLQRVLEIWSHLPFFYVFLGVQSFVQGGIYLLFGLMILFSWTHLSLTLRAQLLSLRTSDAIAMTKIFGFSWPRIAFVHLLPFLYPIFFSLFPFALASTLSSLTALDSLGFALPSRWPSWGELLSEGLSQAHAPWLTVPVLLGLIATLTFTSLIGEASRKATHPRRASEYR